jgi:hypothetical protein
LKKDHHMHPALIVLLGIAGFLGILFAGIKLGSNFTSRPLKITLLVVWLIGIIALNLPSVVPLSLPAFFAVLAALTFAYGVSSGIRS